MFVLFPIEELKKIIQKTPENSIERRNALRKLSGRLGVSISKIEDGAGKDSENILINRIEQRCIALVAGRSWLIASLSAIASVFSALAAWVAVLKKCG